MRTGTVNIGGKIFTVTQGANPNAVSCDYTLSPTSQSFASEGGTGTIDVDADSGCDWSAASSALWVKITSDTSGYGSGSVSYTVSANTGSSQRSAVLTIAGKSFSVTQAGAGDTAPPPVTEPGGDCPLTLSDYPGALFTGYYDKTVDFGYEGGSRSLEVEPDTACSWTTAVDVSWIGLVEGASGSGYGLVTYEVEPNPYNTKRVGTVTVLGKDPITVTQKANPQGSSPTPSRNRLVVFPHVRAEGWITKVVVNNPTTTAFSGDMVSYKADGSAGCAAVPVSIPAQGTVRINVNEMVNGCTADYMVLESEDGASVAPVGYIVYEYPRLGRAILRMTTPVRSAQLVLPDIDGWTGLAMVNTKDVETVVTLKAFDASGEVLASAAKTLGANAKWVGFVEALFPESDISGAEKVSYDTGSTGAPLSMILLSGSGDGTQLDGLPGS